LQFSSEGDPVQHSNSKGIRVSGDGSIPAGQAVTEASRFSAAVVVPFRGRRRNPVAAESMRVTWFSMEDCARYGTATDHQTGLRLHLIAERISTSGEWDWLVWQVDNWAATTMSGHGSTELAAATGAEAAARRWG
jgi:hypothetical protein